MGIREIRFPALYLGFGLLYKKLNRHEKALEYVERGREYLAKDLPCLPVSWPGTTHEPMPETQPAVLRKAFDVLASELRCPPRPDAVCKYRDCTRVQKELHIIPSTFIYQSDPDFRHFYRVVCYRNCLLDYHSDCWDVYKNEFIQSLRTTKTPSERDFFGSPCFTPDCDGVIIRIL